MINKKNTYTLIESETEQKVSGENNSMLSFLMNSLSKSNFDCFDIYSSDEVPRCNHFKLIKNGDHKISFNVVVDAK